MTHKPNDSDRLTFLSQFRLKIESDTTHFWVQLQDGKYCKAKQLREAIDQAMRFTRTKERPL